MAEIIVLITGGNRGIGFEVARQLATNGFTVIVGTRSKEKADAAVSSIQSEGLDVMGLVVDVADDTSVQKLAEQVQNRFGMVDILINNAAAYADWTETASTADLYAVKELFETNIFGAWRMIQAFLPLLDKSESPHMINIGSGGGTFSDEQFGLSANDGAPASYGISKAALHALTVKFAAEFADTNIRFNAAGPGLTATSPGMESMGARPVEDGAASIVQVVMLDDDKTGKLFRDGQQLDW